MNWFTKQIFGFLAEQIHKRLKMRGWISAVSGLSLIASGIGMVLSGFSGDQVNTALIEQGYYAMAGGGAVLGLARKFDRITDRLEAKLTPEETRRLLQ